MGNNINISPLLASQCSKLSGKSLHLVVLYEHCLTVLQHNTKFKSNMLPVPKCILRLSIPKTSTLIWCTASEKFLNECRDEATWTYRSCLLNLKSVWPHPYWCHSEMKPVLRLVFLVTLHTCHKYCFNFLMCPGFTATSYFTKRLPKSIAHTHTHTHTGHMQYRQTKDSYYYFA